MSTAYPTTPKPSSTYLMDISSSCPPPPRRSADESYSFVDNMCPTFPSLNTRNNGGFFLGAPSSPYLLEHDDEDEAFLSYQIPMLKPRASSKARSRVPVCTLKPRPSKAAAGKMSPSLKNSYQLVLKKSGMHRSPSFSPAA